MRVNGTDHPGFESVLPEYSEIALGIDQTLRPDVIRQAIEDISNFEVCRMTNNSYFYQRITTSE
jgi:hypothetical protein